MVSIASSNYVYEIVSFLVGIKEYIRVYPICFFVQSVALVNSSVNSF